MSDMDFETRRVIIETLTKERDEAIETLRDRFAMAALTGLLAGRQPHGVMTKKDWSEAAYKQADAMMEARK